MALVPNRRSQPNVEPWFRLISSSDCTFVFVNNFVRSQATFFLWPIIPQLHWSRIIQRVKSLSGTIHHLSYGPENEYLLCTSWSCFFLANNLIESHYPENYISFGWRTNIYLLCNSPLSGGAESEYLLYTCHVFSFRTINTSWNSAILRANKTTSAVSLSFATRVVVQRANISCTKVMISSRTKLVE